MIARKHQGLFTQSRTLLPRLSAGVFFSSQAELPEQRWEAGERLPDCSSLLARVVRSGEARMLEAGTEE